jgi:drug/metabolite transporter (DMT)-like permease
MRSSNAKTLLLTTLAMAAFAANSLLCRMALGDRAIDAASFTLIRLASGALVLWLLWFRRTGQARLRPHPKAALFLFAYAAAFSFAYLQLDAGTGALILFGAVQLTMVTAGLLAGEATPPQTWVGLTLSLVGLVYLVSPGLTAPPLQSALLMGAAGVAWGLYSLSGKGASDPLQATAGNFLGAVPLALILILPFLGSQHLSASGVWLALASGALASGLGYVIWFAALRGLSASAAASVPISVPLLAAVGGTIWLGESLSWRLALASLLILGGIALVLRSKGLLRGH